MTLSKQKDKKMSWYIEGNEFPHVSKCTKEEFERDSEPLVVNNYILPNDKDVEIEEMIEKIEVILNEIKAKIKRA